jgi:hypothetical protein
MDTAICDWRRRCRPARGRPGFTRRSKGLTPIPWAR